MSYKITVENEKVPNLRLDYFIPDTEATLIEAGDTEKATNIAKTILSVYEPHPTEEGSYYRLVDGHKFLINTKETSKSMQELMRDFMLHGSYEPHTVKLVKEHVKEGDVCIDAGASLGYFTLLLARQVGEKGKVYSFEPTRNQFPYLKANVKANGYENRVEAHNLGVWNEKAVISVNGNSGGRDGVNVVSIDSLVKEPVDFMKMDIDGSEPKALQGMIETIERSPNLKMVIEYYPEYIEKLGNEPKEMMAILDKYFTYEKIEGDYTDTYWNYYCVRK